MRRVLVPSHVFRDLDPERAVLSPLGIEVADGTSLDPDARLEAAREADALLVQYWDADAAVIGTLRCCRVIGSYGVGYDQIDVAAAGARGITVVHVPDCPSISARSPAPNAPPPPAAAPRARPRRRTQIGRSTYWTSGRRGGR